MIHANQIQLIKRLKQQPRHGQVGPIQQVEQALKSLYEAYKIGGDEIIRLNIFGKLAEQIEGVVKDLSILQDLNQGVSEDFNINAKSAAQLGISIDKMSTKLGVNAQKAKTYAGVTRDIIGSNVKFYKQQTDLSQQVIKQNDQLQNQMNISADSAGNLLKYTLQYSENQKKSFDSARESLADAAATMEKLGYGGALTDIIEGFRDLDAKQRTTFGRMPEQLGLAIFKAKKLGVELGTITEGAKGFLDVEEAIANELEFQLLSGEELTTLNGENLTTEMQKAVLAQDANRQVELFAGFVQKYGDELRSNVFLQEQAAAAFGVQQADIFNAMEGMAAINQEQKTIGEGLTNIFQKGIDSSAAAAESFDSLAKKGKEISIQEQARDQTQMAYIQSLNYTADEIEQLDQKLLSGTKATMAGAGGLANQAISTVGGGTGVVSAALRSMSVVADVVNFVTTPSTVFNRQEQTSVGPMQRTDDLFMPATAGTVITGPLGSFALNSKDDILAMPGIGRAVGGAGGGGGESIGSAVASALKGMSFQVINVFDGQKIKSSLQILDQSTLNNINVG
jgi:hypothetical protein